MDERARHIWRAKWDQNHPHIIRWILIGFFSFSLLCYFFLSVRPKEGSVIILFIILLSATVFSFLHAAINNVRRIFLFTSGVGVLLFLRAFHLFDLITVSLLFIFLISLELALKNR